MAREWDKRDGLITVVLRMRDAGCLPDAEVTMRLPNKLPQRECYTAKDSLYDTDGLRALELGTLFYNDGMNTQDPSLHDTRVSFFRAAEVLYLWSASLGNPQAYANLGYVYAYDRCEGAYLGMDMRGQPLPGMNQQRIRDRHALLCFEIACDMGRPEARYKVGDFVVAGRGRMQNEALAARYWERAFNEAQLIGSDQVRGSAALRLGKAYEEGRGVPQDWAKALCWYREAAAGLESCLNDGNWYYEWSLAQARRGVRRCEQMA